MTLPRIGEWTFFNLSVKQFPKYLAGALLIPLLLVVLHAWLRHSVQFDLIAMAGILISSAVSFRYWKNNGVAKDVSRDKNRRVSVPYLLLLLVPPISWILVLGWSPSADSFTSMWRWILSINSKLVFAASIWSAVVLIIWVRARSWRLPLLLLWLVPTILFLIAMKWFRTFSESFIVLATAGWSATIFVWWMVKPKSGKGEEITIGQYGWLPFCLLSTLPPIALITTRWPIDPHDGIVVLFTISWATAVFCLWVGLGEGRAHEANFARYKSIWIVFAFILLITLLGNYTSYSIVEARVNSLQGTAALLISTVKEPYEGLDIWARFGYAKSRDLREDLRNANSVDEAITKFESRQLDLSDSVSKIKSNAARAKSLANSLKPGNDDQPGPELESLSFRRVTSTTDTLAQTADKLQTSWDATRTVKESIKESLKKGQANDLAALRSSASELESNFSDATRETADLNTTLDAIEVNRLAPFVLASVLFNVFLLFPWVVLFLFLFRNHEVLIQEKVRLLNDLELGRSFLDRSEPGTPADPQPDVKERLAQAIRNLAFRNAEYVASLVIFTVMTAAILYFFFFPHATPGLAQLIVERRGVEGFTRYLVVDATPITFGFIGAYFFVINMLLRRYFASDLNPKAYTNAVGRLLTIFILGVVIQLFSNLSGYPKINREGAAIIAFVAGIFPMTALRWISRTANRIVRHFNAPEYIDHYPLTHLDGLNIWHEARFLEEKVESVQNLATAPLDDLIVHTNFSPLQLMDWVDQASLYIHTQDKWTDAFHGVGIRTATNLLHVTCKKEKGHYVLHPESVADLAMAINASQISVTSDGKHSSGVTRDVISGLQKSAAEISRIAQSLRDLSAILDENKPESLDAVLVLKEKITKLADLFKKIQNKELTKLSETTTALPANGNELVSTAKEETSKLQETVKGLLEQAEALRLATEKLDRTTPETLSELPNIKQDLETLNGAAKSLSEATPSLVAIAEQGQNSGADKAVWSKVLVAGKALAEASEQILKEARIAKEIAVPLDKDKPETLSCIAVAQDGLDHLKKASEDLQSDTKKAGEVLGGLEAGPRSLEVARERIDAAEGSGKELAALAEDTMALNASATTNLPEFRKKMNEVIQAASETKAKAQEAIAAIQIVTTPTQITKEIIAVMVKTIEENPNLERLQHFWKIRRRRDDHVYAKPGESATGGDRT